MDKEPCRACGSAARVDVRPTARDHVTVYEVVCSNSACTQHAKLSVIVVEEEALSDSARVILEATLTSAWNVRWGETVPRKD